MEYMWKKESTNTYINFLDIVRNKNKDSFEQWDELLMANLKWLNKYETLQKNNQHSINYLKEGHRKLSVGNINGAIESYNQSLCFAEPESIHESLAYSCRSECFFNKHMYIKAIVDIDLALKWTHSSRIINRLKNRRADCMKLLIQEKSLDECSALLSFGQHEDYSCMANVLEIRENDEFGRHIVAKRNIRAGETVMVTDIYASGTVSTGHSFCRNCNNIQENLIPCTSCSSAMFCIGTCVNHQEIHKLECHSFLSIISDVGLKLAMQTILMAINMFPTIDELIEFVEESINRNELPKSVKNMKSRYGVFLNLSKYLHDDRMLRTYKVYTVLLTIPQINQLLDSEKKRMFIMHLALHHLTVIPQNAFSQDTFNRDWITTYYIYDVLSLINHSCVPNLMNYSSANQKCHCVTLKPIRAGEQVFINYLGNDSEEAMEYRQKLLRMWNFECKCSKCSIEGVDKQSKK